MKTTINFAITCLIVSLFITSCGGGEKSKEEEKAVVEVSGPAIYDLTSQGIPTSIEAPAGASVKDGMSGGEIDGVKTTSVLIDKDMFKLEVNMDSESSGRDLAGLMEFYKDLDSGDEGFEIVKEEANGYIYKSVTMGDTSYMVRYIKINANGEALEMESGFSIPDYTLEDAEKIFAAAKAATWN